jgi:hypothetical protein
MFKSSVIINDIICLFYTITLISLNLPETVLSSLLKFGCTNGLPHTGCSKIALQWYSKRYCMASVMKTFTPKGIQAIRLFETPCVTGESHIEM